MFEEASGCAVSLVNDADAWMFGFLHFAGLMRESIAFPTLLLASARGSVFPPGPIRKRCIASTSAGIR
jgi:hypothetical protein